MKELRIERRPFENKLHFNATTKRLETREQRFDNAGFLDIDSRIDYFRGKDGAYHVSRSYDI